MHMNFSLTVLIGILTLTLNAQTDKIGELNNSGASKLTFVTNEKEAEKIAKLDIKNGNPLLLLMGGIAPTLFATDSKFEKKYAIIFHEFGCSGPDNKIIIAYNKIVFEHLNKTHGKHWIKEVRNDVIGFKEWKKNTKRKK